MSSNRDDENRKGGMRRVIARDALGVLCFAVHLAILIYIFIGWAIRPGLIGYLIFLPAMVLHWQLNKNSCVINNLETLMRTGRWRDGESREEGAWLRCLLQDALGLVLTPRQVDAVSYSLLLLFWGLAWVRWLGQW